MKKNNLYWAVYKNLEREVLELSNQIHFSDNQLDVYSIKIAELLIRCSVEIESIAKELYIQNGGKHYIDEKNREYLLEVDENCVELPDIPQNRRDLFFDTDCIDYLENMWLLSKKKVLVVASNFYFEKEENAILTPLYKANKRGSVDWGKAYQAIKHNRSANFSRGNIKHLIRAMAALYLLNLYHKDDKFDLGAGNNKKIFNTNIGSDLFSIQSISVGGVWDNSKASIKTDECVYIEKWDDKQAQEFEKVNMEANLNLNQNLLNNKQVAQRLQEILQSPALTEQYNEKKSLNLNAIAMEVLGIQAFGNIASISLNPLMQKLQQMKTEVILNKIKFFIEETDTLEKI